MNTIKLKYGVEEIISRIPGLFPYIEFDENHVSTVHPATDSMAGCYGKIACAICIPDNVNLEIDGQYMVMEGKTYSYNTLMNYYYTYKDAYPANTFIQFMQRGIGRFRIPKTLPIDFEKCVLVPEYEYYANAARLYSEYVKIKIMCDKYEEIKEVTGEINCELECLADKYEKMGGDVMMEFYQVMAKTAVRLAKDYRDYAGDTFDLVFNINFVSSNNDLGILNAFINNFGPNETYVHGDEVIYNDRTYVCDVNEGEVHEGPWDETHFHLVSNTDSDGKETVYIPTFNSGEYYHRGEFVREFDYGQVYVCDIPEYMQYEVGDTINAGDVYYTKNNDTYQTGYGMPLPHVVEPGDEYYYRGRYCGAWSTDVFKPKNINGIVGRELTGFRNNNKYIDAGGNIRQPDYGVDWLWYYHIGDVGFYETSTDEFNDIELITGRRVPVGQYEPNLMAYGDVITDIRRNRDENTITIDYVIGAHLKAKCLQEYRDDDNNPHYCYGDFEYDDNDLHGVFHSETYDYDIDSEIAVLSDVDFRKYVRYNQRRIDDMYSTCAFNVNHQHVETEINGTPSEYLYIASEFSSNFDSEMDTLCSSATKFDYLTGVSYNPTVENDVRIRRGNAAAWERHIKLGEIRTFDDLSTYANGGFFNLR